MSYLSVSQLSKTYPHAELPALLPIDFAIEEGEVISFLGESGSGKSTLLNLLAGLLDASEGTVHLAQEAIKGPSSKLVAGYESIKLVQQGLKLSPNMRVWENLRYHLLRTTKSYQTQRVAELLQLCQLDGFAEKYPRELSGGQQQRVAIGRAIAKQPKLLLLDEPFSNLDTILKQELLTSLTEIIKKSGITAIFVMHDTADALRISDRIGIMKTGSLIQFASPVQIYDEPVSAYVARLIGQPTILKADQVRNFLPNFHQNQQVCLRESAISLGNGEENELRVQVQECYFQGDYWKFVFKTKQDLRFYANIPRKHSLQVGQFVKIKVDWEQAYIFKNELV